MDLSFRAKPNRTLTYGVTNTSDQSSIRDHTAFELHKLNI